MWARSFVASCVAVLETSLPHIFERLSLAVLERGWLSSNNVVFSKAAHGATVVDTGYSSHAAQTVALIAGQLGAEPLARIININTHGGR